MAPCTESQSFEKCATWLKNSIFASWNLFTPQIPDIARNHKLNWFCCLLQAVVVRQIMENRQFLEKKSVWSGWIIPVDFSDQILPTTNLLYQEIQKLNNMRWAMKWGYFIMFPHSLYYKENGHLFISLLKVLLCCLNLDKRKRYCCLLWRKCDILGLVENTCMDVNKTWTVMKNDEVGN